MTSVDRFCERRRRDLAARLPEGRFVVPAGVAPARNYPQNRYRFRASSHFLYLVGIGLPGAVLTWSDGEAALYASPPDPDDALWHGPGRTLDQLADELGLEVRPLAELPAWLDSGPFGMVGSVHGNPAQDADAALSDHLADALVALRLVHDEAAQRGLREAAEASVAAHRAGLAATRRGVREWHVRAAMEAALIERGCTTAYNSIVTVHGDVLHNEVHHHVLGQGDLLLADVGAESPAGWAGDVTRTWPVNGRFSATQRALYEVVHQAQRAAIEAVAPGRRFRDVHLRAAAVLAQGLCDLGVLRGRADDRVRDGTYALFMPHGIGHLLGLDVHDMEDLGDRAGYPRGTRRDPQFGLSNLRLDRPLTPGMAVTIEPGFYRIEALLRAPERVGLNLSHVDAERLAQFGDVRGIRIEDDVLVCEGGREVLTRDLPKTADEIEALVGG